MRNTCDRPRTVAVAPTMPAAARGRARDPRSKADESFSGRAPSKRGVVAAGGRAAAPPSPGRPMGSPVSSEAHRSLSPGARSSSSRGSLGAPELSSRAPAVEREPIKVRIPLKILSASVLGALGVSVSASAGGAVEVADPMTAILEVRMLCVRSVVRVE